MALSNTQNGTRSLPGISRIAAEEVVLLSRCHAAVKSGGHKQGRVCTALIAWGLPEGNKKAHETLLAGRR